MRSYIKMKLIRIVIVEHRLSCEISCHSNIPGVLLPVTIVVLVHASCCRIKSNIDESVVAMLYNVISEY